MCDTKDRSLLYVVRRRIKSNMYIADKSSINLRLHCGYRNGSEIYIQNRHQ